MRMTNSIMLNTQRGNINNNKINMDTINNQMSTQKKIIVPSDDPIVAVRALRLRANVSELTQYADKNIEDADSWMEVTEAAMTNMREIVRDMYGQFTQGNNDYLSTTERVALLENLESLVEQYYNEGNASYAGRTIFTGYKTNSDYNYKAADTEADFFIEETFTISQIGLRDYITNSVKIDKGNLAEIDRTDFPQKIEASTFNLTYQGMSSIEKLYYMDTSQDPPAEQEITVTRHNLADGDSIYQPAANGVNYIVETGELVFGTQLVETFSTMDGDTVLTAEYNKKGFTTGEPYPYMHFNCVDNTDPDNPIEYTKEIQEINYNVGFNQSIKVNTEASDVLQLDVGKEIANLRDAIVDVQNVEKKIKEIEDMLASDSYSNDKEALESMLDAANKELDLKQERMVSLFTKGVGTMQEFQNHVELQIADLGNRSKQLKMIRTRMQQQKTNFEELMTQNEDRELSDILLDYTSANYAYQLALQATGSISKLSLLNYI